jgi:MFS family permease
MMFRYADFVLFLGGNEWTVGSIVGLGMVGSLAMRFFQGFGIDRLGARRIWLASVAAFIASMLGNMLVTSSDGLAIYALRVLYTSSLAGAFGASITSVSRRLPLARMAEVIGSLGTSGFIGMAVGPLLGDYFCGGATITRGDLNAMFGVGAVLGVISLIGAELATRGEVPPRRRRRPGIFWLVRRYHPGAMLALAVVMGIGFVVPNAFLPTYIKELSIPHTGPFFIIYAVTAFVTRLSTRRLFFLWGVRPMIFAGLTALTVSFLAYLPVTGQWGLLVPGLFAGIAHALLFPAVTAQGSGSFPSRYRGLGTTVMLTMLDLGTLVGAPFVGGLVEASKSAALPPYTTTFLIMAGGVSLTGAFYALVSRK